MKRIILWWKSRSTNEKMMYGLILVLTVGIITRSEFIWDEVSAAFSSYFSE